MKKKIKLIIIILILTVSCKNNKNIQDGIVIDKNHTLNLVETGVFSNNTPVQYQELNCYVVKIKVNQTIYEINDSILYNKYNIGDTIKL